jgi:uncharacterized ion transporter superfamily protein YfcC
VKKWYTNIPHPVVMLTGMLLFVSMLSYVIPSGTFERVTVDGRATVVAGSFHLTEAKPLSLLDMFVAIPLGFRSAIDIIFIVLASGIMFGFVQHSRAFENAIGSLVRQAGNERKYMLVILMTYLFGCLGIFVGYENNIALIPLAALLSLAIGGDLMLAAGIAVGAVTIGFGLSPFNPYTIGTGQKLAELPLFSGAGLRAALCLSALTLLAWYNVRYFNIIEKNPEKSLSAGLDTSGLSLTMSAEEYKLSSKQILVLLAFAGSIAIILYGVFVHKWFINQISAIFCMLAIVVGLINRNSGEEFGDITLSSVAVVAPGAFMVGFATSIKAALEMGEISDTIAQGMASSLAGLPLFLAGVGMAVAQSCMNFLIPSGSGQALATLPVLIPVGEVIGLTRQTTVLAFQVGDGVSNLINPALGGLIAMLSMCRVPLDRWLRFIFPLFVVIFIVALTFVALSVAINYGPF